MHGLNLNNEATKDTMCVLTGVILKGYLHSLFFTIFKGHFKALQLLLNICEVYQTQAPGNIGTSFHITMQYSPFKGYIHTKTITSVYNENGSS